ncbi:MAG: methionyl-tRNA formyltransferase [Sphingomonas sanxanigenens]|uniref:Methionyl-tRNA formyltransferase n=1 Tax=Sphingomonas sanxanigenens TaxID=397260 RepID=A0A2W5CC41_9SPHN|nr:MAG: methionyl-tRNA formyltransferase [Sphingomonas sanxanigenens]
MRIAFMGTPAFAVPTLDALVEAGHDVAVVYSQPPRRAGRGKALTPSLVHQRAEALGIEVRTPLTLRDEAEQAAFAGLGLDVAVVAAYGLILPRPILAAPLHGCLNVHASLLPRWRGAAPIQRAILAGDTTTGVTIMQMEAGLDTGPMLATVETQIGPYDTAGILTERLSALGSELIVDVLGDLAAHPSRPQPNDGVTYATKIEKAEARIDWKLGAVQVDRHVRAFNPAPGAWFEYGGERIKLLTVRIQSSKDDPFDVSFPIEPGVVLDDQLAIGCGKGAIRPEIVQRAGRGAMTVTELLRGFPIPAGTRL